MDLNNPEVGRFMVAVGAIIEHSITEKILLLRRNPEAAVDPGIWEYPMGRMKQMEGVTECLAREVYEETGIAHIQPDQIIGYFYGFRGGVEAEENEIVGITFIAKTIQTQVAISDEHDEYRWVTPQEAVLLVNHEGIRKDIEAYIKHKGLTITI
jgi:8-oxo-dGTP pyrophosphatase MutT (NUDIX family)